MPLKLNGKAFDPDAPSPATQKVLDYLNNAPKDEIFTIDRLRLQKVAGDNILRDFANSPRFADYVYRGGRRGQSSGAIHYGHPAAIREFKRIVGAKLLGAK